MHTTLKKIELESPGCSGFEENLKGFKLDYTDGGLGIRWKVTYSCLQP